MNTNNHTTKTHETEHHRIKAISHAASDDPHEREQIGAFVRLNEDLDGEPFWDAVEWAKHEDPPGMAQWLIQRGHKTT